MDAFVADAASGERRERRHESADDRARGGRQALDRPREARTSGRRARATGGSTRGATKGMHRNVMPSFAADPRRWLARRDVERGDGRV